MKMAQKHLPDAIILQIVLESDVRTTQNMRLACRAFYALTEAYTNSIVSTIRSQHSETFWKYFSVAAPKETRLGIAFELDRRIRIAKWIAAMALRDRPTMTPKQAEAPATYYQRMDFHVLFDYLVIGLGVIWPLSSMSKAGSPLDRQGIHSWAMKYPPDRSIDHPPTVETDNEIARKQFDHICALDDEGLKAYYYANAYCMSLLYGMGGNPHGPNSGKLCHWYTWFTMQEGLEFFIEVWGSVDGNERCVERLLNARKERSEEQYESESVWVHDVICQRFYRSLGGGFSEHVELVAESEEERVRMVEGWIEESELDGREVREGYDWRGAELELRWSSIAAKRNEEKNEARKMALREKKNKKKSMKRGNNKHRFGM